MSPIRVPISRGVLHIETLDLQHGVMILLASTMRHRGLAAPPRMGKQVVLFHFLTDGGHQKWVDVEPFIFDPLQGPKEELVSKPWGGGPLPANPKAINH